MATINIVILEAEDVVVIRGLEFPGVIVQGKNIQEAKNEFDKSLGHMLQVRAKIARDQYPLTNKEKVETVGMDLVYNK